MMIWLVGKVAQTTWEMGWLIAADGKRKWNLSTNISPYLRNNTHNCHFLGCRIPTETDTTNPCDCATSALIIFGVHEAHQKRTVWRLDMLWLCR